jgi:hypothetical protein
MGRLERGPEVIMKDEDGIWLVILSVQEKTKQRLACLG